jgi:5'-3' exonuclease
MIGGEMKMLIDGHGLAFRAFHAVPMLNSSDGVPTNVIMGFMNMLERLEREYVMTSNKRKSLSPRADNTVAEGFTHLKESSNNTRGASANTSDTILKTSSHKAGGKSKGNMYYQPSLFDEEPCIEKASCEISGVTIVFDAPGKTFRHDIFPEYKQTRKPTPPEFKPQVPLLIELLKYLGYPVLMIDGVEADDTIASACRVYDSIVVSSDKDLLQILRPGVEILRPIKGVSSFSHYDVATFTEEFGFPPESMPDYLALLGDTADNLPGVPGIGEKSALKLVSEYKNIENLLMNIENLKLSHKKNINDNKEQIYAIRELNRLRFDIELDSSLFQPAEPDYAAAISLCEKLNLRQICNRIAIMQQKK